MIQPSRFMSFTINLQQQTFKSLNLQLKNFIFNFTFTRHLSSSTGRSKRRSVDAESFFTSLLAKSARKIHLFQIHSQLHVSGLQSNGFIITKFISRSFDLKEIDYALQVFDEFPDRYVFLWNAVIRGYSVHKMFQEVVETYSRMQAAFVNPDAFTLPNVLKACAAIPAVGYGRAVHAQIFRHGFQEDSFLQNGLLSFYMKCEENAGARVIFDRLKCKDVISWTSIISGFVQKGHPMEALRLFRDMRESGMNPDWIALVSVAKAYSDLEDLNEGKCVHGLAIRMGYELEPDLRIAVTSLYAKCGEVKAAKLLFDQVNIEDVMLWNSMISGFAKSGHASEALKLFNEMISRNIQPNAVTIQSSILASSHLGSLEQAKWMDDYVNNSSFRHNIVIRTALIDMYAKCGSIELARKVFDHSTEKDVFVWSAMIMSYGLHGLGRESLNLFDEMKKGGTFPNEVTFLNLIIACSHSNLVKEGLELFHSMKSYGVEPHEKHYASIVDMLGRAGDLTKAYDFIKAMPFDAGVSVWSAFLSACKVHRHIRLGEHAAEKLFSLDVMNIGHYVQLSNLYASVGLWDGVERVRELMKERRVNKDSRSMGKSRLSESVIQDRMR